DEGWVQLGPLPRRAGGKERLQTDAARLRPGGGLLHADAPGAGSPDGAPGACEEPDSSQTHADHPARRRPPVRGGLARIQNHVGLDCGGMPAPKDADARVEDLEVLPREISLRPGAEQQILVRAHYSDGSE